MKYYITYGLTDNYILNDKEVWNTRYNMEKLIPKFFDNIEDVKRTIIDDYMFGCIGGVILQQNYNVYNSDKKMVAFFNNTGGSGILGKLLMGQKISEENMKRIYTKLLNRFVTV